MTSQQRAEYLANTYGDAILRLSYIYLKNIHDAQDVCQTVLVKLLTRPKEFDDPARERAYVLKTAANTCKDVLKSPWHSRTCDLSACAEVPAPEIPDGSVLWAVQQLPEKYQAVIHLFYYEGYPAMDIGRILGITTATVHTRLARGRARLKELLGEDYE